MGMTALTDDAWPGLPLGRCRPAAGRQSAELSFAMLVFRDSDGSFVQVARARGEPWAFRQKRGHFDLFPAHAQVTTLADGAAADGLVISLTDAWLGGPAPGERRPLACRPRFQFRDRVLERLVRRLDADRRAGEPLGIAYTRALSNSILHRLQAIESDGAAGVVVPCPPLPAPMRARLQQLIDDPRDSPDTADMALVAGLGIKQFNASFKASFGATPHQYVLRRRIERAKVMLVEQAIPLAAVALDMGFASQAHFCTVFRAYTGMTPTSFRRLASRAA